MRWVLRNCIGLIGLGLGAAGAVALQVGFLSALPFPLNTVNLILALVVYRTVTRGLRRALPWALTVGVLYDLYAAWGFGVSAWCFLIVVMVVAGSGRHIFTNRSLFSLTALGVIGYVTFAVWLIVTVRFYQLSSLTAWSWTSEATGEWVAAQLTNLLVGVGLLTLWYASFHRKAWDTTTLEGARMIGRF